MDKLIKKYNEECSLKSKLANRLLKIGYILIVGIFILGNINVGMFFIFSITLYMSCNLIMLRKIASKLNIKFVLKELLFKRKSRTEMYKKVDEFQKKGITNYCKKNRIDSIEKLKIIREKQ